MKYEFDKTISTTVGGELIEYGFVWGNAKIVFIKTGSDGTVRGYEDKYLKMAHRVHERLGATVICATNPEKKHTNFDEQVIRTVATKRGFREFELYLVGTSDGGYKNLELATRFFETVKYLGINTSLSSLEDLKDKLMKLSHIGKILVLGTRDDDYKELSALKDSAIDNFKMIFVDGADHEFAGRVDEFVGLIDLL